MSRSARKQCKSNIYHIFIRGVGRQLIFEDDQDREMFLELLRHFMGTSGKLFAWVLMDNHVHIIIKDSMDNISSFMRKVEGSYSGYFNRRHDRAGHLFQGRFGSEGIEDDQQLLAAIRYVHQNPLAAGMSDSCNYKWSSYNEYLGKSQLLPVLCDTSFVLKLLGGPAEFKRFHLTKESKSLEKSKPLMDIEEQRHRYERISDAQAIRISTQILGEGWRESLDSHDRAYRNEKLQLLKEAGLSIRQIERLTGIGRSIIQRC